MSILHQLQPGHWLLLGVILGLLMAAALMHGMAPNRHLAEDK